MKYLVLKKQHNKGCGYTIGCGMKYYFDDFDGPLDEAVKYFSQRIAYPDGPEYECEFADKHNPLSEVWIIPANDAVPVDIQGILSEYHKRENEKSLKEERAKDLKLLAELKEKYDA